MTEEPIKHSNILYKVLLISGFIAVGGIITAGYVILGRSAWKTHDVEFEVVDLKWERKINVEDYGLVTREGWKEQLPKDAKILSERPEFKRNEKFDTGKKAWRFKDMIKKEMVEESYPCGTSGKYKTKYCTRKVPQDVTRKEYVQEPVYEDRPVYDTMYNYETTDWHIVAESVTDGQGFSQKPEWKLIEENPTHRMGARSEFYILKLSRRDLPTNVYYIEVPNEQIAQISAGSKIYLDVDDSGNPLNKLSRDIKW